MKFFLTLVLIIVIGFALQVVLPWWIIAIICFVLGFVLKQKNGWLAFFVGFLGVFLLWGGYAFLQDSSNQQILSSRMAELFQLPSPILLVLVTGLLGALVGAFSSLCGYSLHRILVFEPKRKRRKR